MSTIGKRAADIAHKTAVTGLFGVFCVGTFTVINQVVSGKDEDRVNEHPQAGFIDMLKTKAEEEYKKYYKIDHREWYDKDDDSYLKQIPRPEEYAPKKK
mmetsp:Transcript_19832/g.24460  ORF Transcript_19832/g.24460 Transcript_19832/m.24460 type:complete len:99 (+) Transcript_19832:143-439(+)